jgi:hypothetical protein
MANRKKAPATIIKEQAAEIEKLTKERDQANKSKDIYYDEQRKARQEIDEFIPVGDLGDKPIRLKFRTADPHYREDEARKILSDLETEALR